MMSIIHNMADKYVNIINIYGSGSILPQFCVKNTHTKFISKTLEDVSDPNHMDIELWFGIHRDLGYNLMREMGFRMEPRMLLY